MINYDNIAAAREVISNKLDLTPVFSSEIIGRRIGARLMLKAELFQKTGSFKPRGVLNRLNALSVEEKERGLITISAGNHAQALAWGASQFGIASTVVMPQNAPRSKVNATESYGATVVLHGNMSQAFAKMEELRVERNLTLVHPFDDPFIMAGQGTVGAEIAAQVPDVTKVIVPVGGGGLISGIATAIKHLKPDAKVYGVEPHGASAMFQSRAAGHTIRLDNVDTVADGLSAPFVGKLPFEIAQRLVDDVIVMSDEQIVAAMRLIWSRCKLMAEPAAAAGVAALLNGKIPLASDDVVVVVISGGNIDLDRLKEIL